jgi:hypothetical protein
MAFMATDDVSAVVKTSATGCQQGKSTYRGPLALLTLLATLLVFSFVSTWAVLQLFFSSDRTSAAAHRQELDSLLSGARSLERSKAMADLVTVEQPREMLMLLRKDDELGMKELGGAEERQGGANEEGRRRAVDLVGSWHQKDKPQEEQHSFAAKGHAGKKGASFRF